MRYASSAYKARVNLPSPQPTWMKRAIPIRVHSSPFVFCFSEDSRDKRLRVYHLTWSMRFSIRQRFTDPSSRALFFEASRQLCLAFLVASPIGLRRGSHNEQASRGSAKRNLNPLRTRRQIRSEYFTR